MRINDFTPPLPTAVDFNATADAPLPPEMPPEVHAAFSLTQLLDRSMKAFNRNLENMLKVQPNAQKMAEVLLAGGTAELVIAEFMEQVHAKRIRSQMFTQQLQQCGAVMTHCMAAMPGEQQQQLVGELQRIWSDLLSRPLPDEIAEELDPGVKSSNDFFDKLLELIDLIKNGYLAGYEHILKAYSAFFSDFNAEITAVMKDWIIAIDEGKYIAVSTGPFRAALEKLIQKYTLPNPAAVLFPKPGQGGASKEEAEKWLKALGLPESCLVKNPDGSYCVVIDTGPLRLMKDGLPAQDFVHWDPSRFQSWQTGFNAQEERMKNLLQSLTQKYSNANAYHDNFNKVLSSHLNQFADMLKAMLNF
ncbi:IpaD/SipD/SspD family type III secretion system needle tip protein [Pseudomonas putida]|uniref:IpaD/SipD/SspD family type III secretion system needle tip protein n=1 Tax=Pseudomonas putida TaxID=303 RepID=UPI003D98AC35